MATEALVSFAVERIGDILIQEAIFLKGVSSQADRLHRDLRAMQCFLEEADKKQEEDSRVRNWVSEIREAVYDAEDIIDMFTLNAWSLRTNFFLNRVFKKLINRYKVGKKIEALQLGLLDISNRRESLGIQNIGEGTSCSAQMLLDLRRSTPHAEEHVLVGLEKEAKTVVNQLIHGDQRRRVISIVGMGGIGKTTLAKNVYARTEVVQQRFPGFRAWAYVSQDCRPRDVYMQIIKQVCTSTKEEAEMVEKMSEHELGDFLREHLKKKRYLIVLDDVWSCGDWDCLAKVSSNDPDCLGNVFPEEGNGSRLLLTTRYKDVALHADARSIPQEMQLLSKTESWELFCRKAFLDAERYPPDLEQLGREMVDKCNGLPLAIVVVGGLLSRNMSHAEWRKVRNNIGTAYLAKEGQMGVMTVLNLSYIDLPSYLKPCFLHLSLFPEDYVISTRKLLLLWIAEGFVSEKGGEQQSMKDTAEVYLNELINRNLIQTVEVSVNSRVMRCRVHDLIRELAIRKAKEQNFFGLTDRGSPDPLSSSTSTSSLFSSKCRRQSIYSDIQKYASMEHSTPYLRSLLFFNLGHETCRISQLDFIGKCFKILRVLDLEGLEIESLPTIVGKLIHLRYLGLKHSSLKLLPLSIGNLRTLQTLDTNNLKRVPNVIWKIKNMRYLYLEGQEEEDDHIPLQIDTLEYLEVLSGITFKQWIQNNSSKLAYLQKLKLEGRCEVEEAEFSNSISKMHGLKSLHLKASGNSSIPSLAMNSCLHLFKLDIKGRLRKLPEAFQFPPNLSQLTLEATRLDSDPMPILEKLPNLLTLRLRSRSYLRYEMRLSENGFPKLRVLQLFKTKLKIKKGAMAWLMQLQCDFSTNIVGVDKLTNLVDIKIVDFKTFVDPTTSILMFSKFRVKKCQDLYWDYSWITNKNGYREFWLRPKKGQTSESSIETLGLLFPVLELSEPTWEEEG